MTLVSHTVVALDAVFLSLVLAARLILLTKRGRAGFIQAADNACQKKRGHLL